MKKIIIGIALLSVVAGASAVEAQALVNRDKYNAFVKSAYEKVITDIRAKGKSAVARPFLKTYDRNKDGWIDHAESKVIEKELKSM